MLQLAIAVCIGVGLIYVLFNTAKFVISSRRHLNQLRKIPAREPHPFWGHLDEFPGPGEAGLQYMFQKISENPEGKLTHVQYGPIFGGTMVAHFDSVKAILRTSEPKPRSASFGGYRLIYPWLGDGLLLSGGKKWSRNRRLLTPAFHFDILKPYASINNQCVDIFQKKMSHFAKTGEYFEVFSQISLLTLDIILKCAFSYDIDCQTMGYQHPYVQAVSDLSESVVHRFLRPWFYPDWIYSLTPRGRKFKKNCDFVHSVAEDIIKQRRTALDKHGDSIMRHHKYKDFLDILLKAEDTDGQGLSDIDIRDEVDTFLFEGHDTTASGISWTLYSLAEHPEIQKKCQKEVDAVLEGRDSQNLLWDDLSSFPYLTMCIKEALRLHTVVPYIQRITTQDMKIEEHTIPKNTIIDINIYLLHHHPAIWEEPYEFRPERFSPENIEKQDPYQYVPFSAGPRNCIGQNFAMHEMKVAIARILRSFTLQVHPTKKAKHEIRTVMKTEDGMYLKVIPRNC